LGHRHKNELVFYVASNDGQTPLKQHLRM